MSAIVMVTGGARSGKSAFAERYARESGKPVGYIATAVATDADMRERIRRHCAERPPGWPTFEMHRGFAALADDRRFAACGLLILDCLSTMITNHMMDSGLDFDACPISGVQALEDGIAADTDALMALVRSSGKTLVAVTNEVGMGVVPAFRMGSLFRDIAGRVNMRVAAAADEVYCMISGLALRLK